MSRDSLRDTYFEWDTEPGMVDIKDIILHAEGLHLTRADPNDRFHPLGQLDRRVHSPLVLARHYDQISSEEIKPPPGTDSRSRQQSWPEIGTRFVIEIKDLSPDKDNKERSWSPRVSVEVFDHQSFGASRLQNRTKYIYNWAAYRYDAKWNEVLTMITAAHDAFINHIRSGSIEDMDDFDV